MLSRLSHAVKRNFTSTPSITAQPNRGLAIAYEMGDGEGGVGGGGQLFTKSYFAPLCVICIFIRCMTSVFSL